MGLQNKKEAGKLKKKGWIDFSKTNEIIKIMNVIFEGEFEFTGGYFQGTSYNTTLNKAGDHNTPDEFPVLEGWKRLFLKSSHGDADYGGSVWYIDYKHCTLDDEKKYLEKRVLHISK